MKVRGLGANSALALSGDIASKAGALLVLLVAARLFSVQEFAAVATALACVGLLTTALDLGAATLLARDGASGAADRGALLRGLVQARAPFVAVVLVVALVVGLGLGETSLALAVALFSISGALALSVLGAYRSCQDLRPEALQRLAAAILAAAITLVCGLVVARADVLLVGLALVTFLSLVPLLRRLPEIADLSHAVGPAAALRGAAPIGLIALATVAYYRSGTIALAVLAGAHETGVFTLAASLAFGLLMIPNAITTALLPRLAVEPVLEGLVERARRALGWTFGITVAVAAAAAVLGQLLVPLLVGAEYSDARYPFALLCAGIPIIAASGVIGTALLAIGRLRPLAAQVSCTLIVNLVALILLVPRLESMGAALATVICELVGLLLLAVAARRVLPGLLSIRGVSLPGRVAPTTPDAERALGA
jgi:O-antigen/teichoic acid export membrane protein